MMMPMNIEFIVVIGVVIIILLHSMFTNNMERFFRVVCILLISIAAMVSKLFFMLFISAIGIKILGKGKSFNLFKRERKHMDTSETKGNVNEILTAVKDMAKEKTGALIVLAEEDVGDHGTAVNADVSRELLESIFKKNTPLHDGATIISGGQISSAGNVVPLGDDDSLPKDAGTRHRAALGVSEFDEVKLSIIVSEENGDISVASNGKMKVVSSGELEEILKRITEK